MCMHMCPRRAAPTPQGIPTLGFGIGWAGVDGRPAGLTGLTELRASRLRAEATRKTLMPAMVHLCEARAEAVA